MASRYAFKNLPWTELSPHTFREKQATVRQQLDQVGKDASKLPNLRKDRPEAGLRWWRIARTTRPLDPTAEEYYCLFCNRMKQFFDGWILVF